VSTRRTVAVLAVLATAFVGLVAGAVQASARSATQFGSRATTAAGPLDASTAERSLRATGGAGLVLRRAADGVVHQMGTAPGRPVGPAAGTTAGGDSAARNFLTTYGALFGLRDPARELRVRRSTALAAGQHLTRFEQVAGGLPVFGGELVVVTDGSGDVLSAGGETARSVRPAAARVTAGSAAATAVRATAKGHPNARGLAATAPSLVAYDPSLLGAPGRAGASPVWRVDVRGAGVRDLVLVDAASGIVVLHFSELAGTTNRLVCDFGNAVIDDTSTPPGYACATSNGDRAEGGPVSAVADVNGAYDNSGAAAAFYQGTLGVDLTALIGSDFGDGAGVALRSSTRVCVAGAPCPYPNAFWDGAQMVYGAGFAGAEDVVGHEMTHGVTQHTSNLAYVYQSGAINESMSDVLGELIDQADGVDAPDTTDAWLLGEDLPGGAGRSLSDPPAFGQPDRMTSPRYQAADIFTDNGGVHTNSGVGNKAGYLVAHGGTFNSRTVTGLGIAKTANIYYRTEQLLSSGADYADLAATLPAACQQLATAATAGIVAADCIEVQAAVDAVEMSAQPTTGAAAPEAPVCSPGKTQRMLFADSMETTSDWHAGNSSWRYDLGYATSGQRSLSGSTPTGAAPNVYGGSTQAIPLYVTAGPTSYIRFSHYDEFDHYGGVDFDGGQVQYSINAGSTWADAGALPSDNGYNATIRPGATTSFRGFGAFSSGYVSTRINVSSLGGHSVLFRFQILGDGEVASNWLVDDFSLYQCGYPAAITIGATAPAALYGYGVTVRGSLTYAVGGAPVPPIPVTLVWRHPGSATWAALASTTSTSAGTYAFAVKPSFHTEYQARFAGSTSFLPATSGTVIVTSVPVVAASASPATLRHGSATHVTVTVRPGHAAQQVVLQRLVGSTWAWVANGTLNASSAYTFTAMPATAGTYTYRVYKNADADHSVGISANITVHAT